MARVETFLEPREAAATASSNKAMALVSAESVAVLLLTAGLAWAPFWLGSNRPIAWGVNAVIFPGLAALYECSLILRGLPHPVPLRRIALPAFLFAAVVAWILLQNSTWTPTAWHHPIWQLASETLDRPIAGSVTVERSLTAIALLRLVTAASVFWLGLQLCSDPRKARFLLWAIVGISAVYAALGIFALGFMPNGRLFADLPQSKFVTSTFVNQNHYATFAGIGFVAAAGLIMRLYRRELDRTGHLLRLQLAALIDTTGRKCALPLVLALVILTGLLFSGSRGGILSTGFGFVAFLIVNARRDRQALRQEGLVLAFAALLVAFIFMGFSDVFLGRLENQGLFDQGRPRLYIATLISIIAAPILGFGYGTFAVAFPMFHDSSLSMWTFWDKAHNTYLETLQGLGLVFGVILIGSVLILVWGCLKGARIRKHHASIPAIAVGISFLVGVNALIDFSLQIQAVTLTYMAILGAGVAQARDARLETRRSSPDARSRRLHASPHSVEHAG